jgi:hypothetical protein
MYRYHYGLKFAIQNKRMNSKHKVNMVISQKCLILNTFIIFIGEDFRTQKECTIGLKIHERTNSINPEVEI